MHEHSVIHSDATGSNVVFQRFDGKVLRYVYTCDECEELVLVQILPDNTVLSWK